MRVEVLVEQGPRQQDRAVGLECEVDERLDGVTLARWSATAVRRSSGSQS